MSALTNFILAFILSFAGSIPPGTINLSVIQLGLQNRITAALRFSLAASIIEYPYAWIAVKFEQMITASPVITENLQLLGGLVLIILGVINLTSAKKTDEQPKTNLKSGYRKGILIGILNPLAIPYWIGMTAYLRAQNWIDLSSNVRLHSYLLGVFAGALLLLVALTYLSKRITRNFGSSIWLRRIPAYLLLVLGAYSIVDYFF